MANPTAEQVLSKPLLDALEDVSRWHRHQPYIWKPKSMEKLAALGYVETEQLMFCGKIPYTVTAKGREYLAKHA